MKKILVFFTSILIFCSSLQAKTPKYIFLMFGDGMGMGSIVLTENWKSWVNGSNYNGEVLNFRTFPYFGCMTTYPADRITTGSSEAATAMFCGVKSNSGYTGVDTEGNPVESIASKLHKEGYQIGLISTDPLNHATPAAMYAHTTDRWNYRPITVQLPESGFEFLCGDSFIDFENVQDGMNADQYMEANGYSVFYGYDEFKARPECCSKAVVCNPRNRETKSLITAEIDKNKKYILTGDQGTISPSDKVRICLEFLNLKKPFLILCEEGEIDHYAHNNSAMGTVQEVLKLEDAVSVALDFYYKHPKETLVIVFSDHETGGIVPGGHGFIDWEEVKAGNDNNFKWTTHSHSAFPVPVFAIGAGAERFVGSFDNTEFSGRVMGN